MSILVGKDVEELELSCTAGRNVKWYSHFILGKKVWQFLKKLIIHLPHDPATLLLGITQEK